MSRMKKLSNLVMLKACPARVEACKENMENTFTDVSLTANLLKCKAIVGYNVCKNGDLKTTDCPGSSSSTI
jgi:hypothetical protein